MRDENIFLWVVLVLLMVLLFLGMGCATAQHDRHIPVQPFTLHVVTDMTSSGFAGYKGYCHERDIWVKWQGTHPDFETLGHEVWHLMECGGQWHGEFKAK